MTCACIGSGKRHGLGIYLLVGPEGHVMDIGDIGDFWSLSALRKSSPVHVCVHKKRQVEIKLRERFCLTRSRGRSRSGLEQEGDRISEKYLLKPSAALPLECIAHMYRGGQKSGP